MINLKSKVAILILIILNFMGIMINLPIEIGAPPSYLNFIFSVFYLFVWVGFGIYFYTKKELTIYLYMVQYWILVMFVATIDLIITLQNAQVALDTSSMFHKLYGLSIVFDTLFLTPLYGSTVVFNLPLKEWFFSVILLSMIFVIFAISIMRKHKKLQLY